MSPSTSAALALVLAVAVGCGEERSGDGPGATDPTPSAPSSAPTSAPSSDSASPSPSEEAWTEVAILAGTAAGGTVSTEPTRLDTPPAIEAFVAQFERRGLGADVRRSVEGADLPEGHVPVGAVISVGCDVPPGVEVDPAAGFSITAKKVASPLRECFAAITSVALLTIPEAAL